MTRGNQVWQKEAGKGKVSEMILKRMRSKQQGKKLMVWSFNIFLYKFHSIKKKSIQQLFAKFVSHVFQISLMFSKRAMNSPKEDEIQVNMLERISISEPKYAELQQNIENELHELHTIIQVGWPATKHQVPHSIRQYWNTHDELPALDGVIYRGTRIIVPPSMRPAMLELIHGTNAGIVKCKQRAREARNECTDRRESERLHHVP